MKRFAKLRNEPKEVKYEREKTKKQFNFNKYTVNEEVKHVDEVKDILLVSIIIDFIVKGANSLLLIDHA